MTSLLKHYRTVELTDETTGTGITYVGTAKIPAWLTLTLAKAKPIRQIIKYVKTWTTTVLTDKLYPLDATVSYTDERIFVWNNRASLTYDA